jgi:thiamine pyrophosphate-dependent acetolactate synthase large subunit-like protein
MTQITVAKAIGALLAKMGTEVVFGVNGQAVCKIYANLQQIRSLGF